MPRSVSSKSTAEKSAKKQTKKAVKSDVVEEEIVEEPIVNSDSENNGSGSEVEIEPVEVDTIQSLIDGLIELQSTSIKIEQRKLQDLKKLSREIAMERKKNEKLLSKKQGKEKKPRNTDRKEPIYIITTSDARQFIEKNYQQLTNKDGNPVLTELNYNDDGNLLTTRNNFLKFVNSYIRFNKLQYEDNKKRIKLDKTLQKLFPAYVEKKDKSGKITNEEKPFLFTNVMEAINGHLQKVE